MTIPKGYKVLLISPENEVFHTIEMGGFNLDKPLAVSEFVREVKREIGIHVVNTTKL